MAEQPERPEKVERVTSVDAKRRRRGLGRKFKDTFVEGDARSALEHVVSDIVVPTVRDLLFDALQGGLDRMIYGETPRRGSRPTSTSSYSNVGHVDYQRMSQNKPAPSRMLSRQARARHDFNDIIVSSRRDAEEVLDRMYDVLGRYGSVQVSVLYELTGIRPEHTDEKWGWTSLRGARIASQRSGGYLLDLPEPESLER